MLENKTNLQNAVVEKPDLYAMKIALKLVLISVTDITARAIRVNRDSSDRLANWNADFVQMFHVTN